MQNLMNLLCFLVSSRFLELTYFLSEPKFPSELTALVLSNRLSICLIRHLKPLFFENKINLLLTLMFFHNKREIVFQSTIF